MTSRPPDPLVRLQSDEQLVKLAQTGTEHAFTAIVERYRRELFGLACRMGARERADDLVQQTFLSAFAAVTSGTQVRHLRGWLYRILRNEVIRTASRPVLEVELDSASMASEPLEEFSLRRMLAIETLSSVAALPARQRHALIATALSGQTRAAVADSMGVSEGAVRQLMHRARASVRAAVAAVTPSPLANWIAGLRSGAGKSPGPEIAIGAGGSSAAGVAVKLGAILASGVIATGIVGSHLTLRPAKPAGARLQPAQVASQAALHASGVARGASGNDLVPAGALRARGIASSGRGAAVKPTGFTAVSPGGPGSRAGGNAGHHQDAVSDRIGANEPLNRQPGAGLVPRGDSRGGEEANKSGPTPVRGAAQPADGGSSGREGSASGTDGSGGGGSGRGRGGSTNSGHSEAGASSVGEVTGSSDGSRDGGSSASTALGTGSSDGGEPSTSSKNGSTDASGRNGDGSGGTDTSSDGSTPQRSRDGA